MERLNRTFVSHNAKYIIIYDDAVSSLPGRTFEWRLQTKGTLNADGEKTYKINHGTENALVKILAPSDADWAVTKNKIGNILYARLEGQQKNNFMVLVWPGQAKPDALTEIYNTSLVAGVKITLDGNNEYTLFQKSDNVKAAAGGIGFNGNTLLLLENQAGKSLTSASLVNGNYLGYNTVDYFSSNERINFAIESISAGKDKVYYIIGPSSSSGKVKEVTIGLGGLLKNNTYILSYILSKEGLSKSTGLKTDKNGLVSVTIYPDKEYKYLLTKDNR